MTQNTQLDERQQKGLVIAATSNITKRGNETYIVPSQSLNGKYAVTVSAEGKACTCPDFELRQQPCKHVFAVQYLLFRESTTETKPDGTVTTTTVEKQAVKVTYSQDWTNYNRAQCAEKEVFCHLLNDLCSVVPSPVQEGRGRRAMPMSDALFCAAFKVYSTMSSRRFQTDLRDAEAKGLIAHAPHFNSVLNVIENAEITPILHELIAASAAPLRAIESQFAIDSTGFGTQRFYNHFSAKYGHDQISREYVKLHAMVGTVTNVIVAATITDRRGADSLEFRPLLKVGAETFDVKEISADKAYSGRKNAAFAEELGVQPLIPFLKTAKDDPKSPAWSKLFHLFNYKKEQFLEAYHRRSNVESTFSMLKRIFGDTLRSKGFVAQVNELLLMVLAHNIRVLVHSIFELGVEVPGISGCTINALAAHQVGVLVD